MELLQETKCLYVKSETVLDHHQQLKSPLPSEPEFIHSTFVKRKYLTQTFVANIYKVRILVIVISFNETELMKCQLILFIGVFYHYFS